MLSSSLSLLRNLFKSRKGLIGASSCPTPIVAKAKISGCRMRETPYTQMPVNSAANQMLFAVTSHPAGVTSTTKLDVRNSENTWMVV